MKTSILLECVMALSTGSILAQSPAVEDMFPFVIPGLTTPSEDSIVDLPWLNDSPAGVHGFVRVRDGHFVDSNENRIRYLATPESAALRLV